MNRLESYSHELLDAYFEFLNRTTQQVPEYIVTTVQECLQRSTSKEILKTCIKHLAMISSLEASLFEKTIQFVQCGNPESIFTWIETCKTDDKLLELYSTIDSKSDSIPVHSRMTSQMSILRRLAHANFFKCCSISQFVTKFCSNPLTAQDAFSLLCKRISIPDCSLHFDDLTSILKCIFGKLENRASLYIEPVNSTECLFETICRVLTALLKFGQARRWKRLIPYINMIIMHVMGHLRGQNKELIDIQRRCSFGVLRIFSALVAHENRTSLKKHLFTLICFYISAQQSSNRFDTHVNDNVSECMYLLLDVCGEREKEYIMAQCDSSGRVLFKTLYANYISRHKYTGNN